MQIDSEILKAVAVTAELTGTEITEMAAKVFAMDLAEYPKASVMTALTRCRRELKGRLTLADVLNRVAEMDGRPSADEAWAMMPMDEAATVVWTDEMAAAWGVALPMVDTDKVAARMAFKAAYQKGVDEARQTLRPVKWRASLGHDKAGREPVIRQAVQQGRLSRDQALKHLPRLDDAPLDMAGQKQLATIRATLLPHTRTPSDNEEAA